MNSIIEEIGPRILYEDNHLIIINKKSGEIVQADKTGDTPLVEKVRDYLKVSSPVTPTPHNNAVALDAPKTLLTQVWGVDYEFK